VLPGKRSSFDFDDVADAYDAWYNTSTGSLYDRIEKRAVEEWMPPPSGGDRLLEVGSGTGHWSRFFARAGFRVTGLDCAPGMVRAARAKRIEGTTFLIADAMEIPFASGSFDVTVAITTLEFVTQPDRALSEMARCTRRGGTLIVGALNRNSILGIRRRRRPSPIFEGIGMLTVEWIREHLAAYGRPHVRTVAYSWPRLGARSIEWVGRKAHLPWGDFIVAACRVG